MQRSYILNLPEGKQKEILPGLSISLDKSEWDALIKGNKSLQAMLDLKRLVTSESATSHIEMKEVEPEELGRKSGDAEKPAELQNTADAEEGKAKHEVKAVEMVEIDAPKKKTAKGKAKK